MSVAATPENFMINAKKYDSFGMHASFRSIGINYILYPLRKCHLKNELLALMSG